MKTRKIKTLPALVPTPEQAAIFARFGVLPEIQQKLLRQMEELRDNRAEIERRALLAGVDPAEYLTTSDLLMACLAAGLRNAQRAVEALNRALSRIDQVDRYCKAVAMRDPNATAILWEGEERPLASAP